MKPTGVRTLLDLQLEALENRVARKMEALQAEVDESTKARIAEFEEDIEIVMADVLRLQRELAKMRRMVEISLYLAFASIAFALLIIFYGAIPPSPF